MKIYKDKQYLVFDFENGRNVKYDFATKVSIGIKGKPVKGLNKQLQGLTLDQLFDCCVDKQYAKFLKFISRKEHAWNISNIGTILNKVPLYSKYEQFFSAGFEDVVSEYIHYDLKDIPKSLLKNVHNHNISLNNDIISFWKSNPNDYNLAYQLNYVSLDDKDIFKILSSYKWNNSKQSYFNKLIKEFNYNAKSLLSYIDQLKTFEAIENMNDFMGELYDYADMMNYISKKYDKYPRHFLTTHRIACRNYNRLKKEFSEQLFKQRINLSYECGYKDYIFIYPKCVQDIRDEAVSMNNCVASYIDRVIDGYCDILFLRKKDSPNNSLVTIEVANNKIVQAKRRFNYPVTQEDQEAIDYWNKKFSEENK